MIEQFRISENNYNFGWYNRPEEVQKILRRMQKPFFAQAAPNLKGTGVGKDSKIYMAYKTLFGSHMPAQKQPRGTCFTVDTPVLLANNVYKKIGQIEIGDWVLTHLGNKKQVTNVFKRKYTGKLYTINTKHKSVTATEEHPILVQNRDLLNHPPKKKYEWMPIKNIIIGDLLCGIQKDMVIYYVVSVFKKEVKDIDVYNIEVEDDNSYIVDGISVHNCVSRGWSRAVDNLQCMLILSGSPLEYKFISHAYIYGNAKDIGHDLSPQDGAVGAWASHAVIERGVITNEDCNDKDADYDDLAVKWGAQGVPTNFQTMGKQHLVKTSALVTTPEEARDALVNGYPIPVCSDQGFQMTRDSEGYCAPQGSWGHSLEKGSLVTTENGIIPIENILIGDKVYSHDGKLHEVTQTYKHNYINKLYTIKAHGNLALKTTYDHPILIYRNIPEEITIYPKGNLIDKISTKTFAVTKLQSMWITVSKVEIGDFVVTPKIKFTKQSIPQYAPLRKCLNTPNPIELSEDMSWLCGLFIGDGSISPNHRIEFTLACTKQIQKLCEVSQKVFGLPACVYDKGTYSRIRINSSILARYFAKQFYDDNKQKIIPQWLLTDFTDSLIDGLIDSDGHRREGIISIYNTSRKLIIQLHHLLINKGLFPNIYTSLPNKGQFDNARQGYNISFNENFRRKLRLSIDDNLITEIESITTEDFSGDVYNLEVADTNSYVSEGIVAHNCMQWEGYDSMKNRFLIAQSWGAMTPNGPLYLDQPDNTFWVSWDVAARMLSQGDSFAISAFDGFPAQTFSWYI